MADEEEKASRKRRRRSKGSQTEMEEDAPPPCCCKETLDKIHEKLDLALAAVQQIDELKLQANELKVKNEELEKSLKFAHEEIDDLKMDVKNLTDSLDSQYQSVEQIRNDLQIEIARGVKLESHSRRNNLRFYNISENLNESYEDAERALREFIARDLKGGTDTAKQIALERVHRVGKRSPSEPRPLIAKFSFFKEKEQIRRMAKNLKGSKFGISEDFAPEILEVRKKLMPVLKKAWKEGRRAFLRYDQLFIEGELYTGLEAYRPYVLKKSLSDFT